MSEIDWKAKAQAAIVTLHKEALAADDCFQVMDGVDPRTILALFELTGIAPKGLAQTAPLSAPMTISLEEHVARAILDEFWKCAQEQDWSGAASSAGRLRRAAIAAVREREGAEIARLWGACNKCGYCGPVADRQGTHSGCNYGASIVEPPDPAEAMRAKCEAIAREEARDEPAVSAERDACLRIADAITALKGNGEGR